MTDSNDRFLTKAAIKHRWIRPMFLILTAATAVLAFCGLFHIHALCFFHFQFPVMVLLTFILSLVANKTRYNPTGETNVLNSLFGKELKCSKCGYNGVDSSDSDIVTVDYKRVVDKSDYKDHYIKTEGNTRYYRTAANKVTEKNVPFGATINKPDFTTKCLRCGHVDHWHISKGTKNGYKTEYVFLKRNGEQYDEKMMWTEDFVHHMNTQQDGHHMHIEQ